MVLGYVIDSRNHTSVAAGSGVVEDLDGVQLGLLGDTVGDGANGAGNMGTMA